MKVLLLGGGGYMGTRLASFLKEIGMSITVVDLFWFGDFVEKGIKTVHEDVSEITVDAYTSFDAVVYLAGLSNDPMAEFSPRLNYIHNAAYPMLCATNARDAGVKRFVFASSCSIYGRGHMCGEYDSVKTDYPYGISKWQAEQGLGLLETDDFKLIFMRKGTLGGHSDRMRFDIAVNRMFKTVMVNNKITVYDPNAFRPLLDINDALRAYASAITAPPHVHGPYNIVSENVTILDMAMRIKQYMEQEKMAESIHINNLEQKEVRDYSANWNNAMNDLGFTGNTALESTIDELWANRDRYDYADPNTVNIEVFTKIQDNLCE